LQYLFLQFGLLQEQHHLSLGVTVNSITVDVEPLIFDIEATFKELRVI